MEILLPAGSEESLIAAVRCGADSVYLGGSHLNARRGAANFDARQLASAVSFCHARGTKVYLTVNILTLERELLLLRKTLEHACLCGVDAILVQDLAVAAVARKACPGLALHASTQMSVHNPAGARFLEELGFSRAVLARELTIPEIREIKKSSAIELEAFIHGALCMSVSGQCYLSALIGGRSGNRGLCAQPCRLPFSFGREENALSLKDLSVIERIKELEDAGISCVKVEGRMKRPEYVAAAAVACIAARDGNAPDMEALAAVFSRGGFTQGYPEGKRDRSMFGVRRKEDVTAATNALLKKQAELYRKETQRVPATLSLTVKEGLPAVLEALDREGNSVVVRGEIPQEARTAPTDGGRARAALLKTKDTPFYPERI
ncbi:MAG: U32 family peptidase, partial [Oscillospiraceae bacterium]|nr:U32 family peptidase [Oscillospiraceae bacterium]